MAFILHLETSTTACSVALAENGNLIGSKEIDNGYSHSENLAAFIRDVLADNDLSASDLKAVAVSKGPGSYTGLRIGVSTAKGLCYALGIPLLSIPTLEIMVKEAMKHIPPLPDDNFLLCPMVDARRMEVYTALYSSTGDELQPVSAIIVDENSFAEELKNDKVYFFGNGAEKCMNFLGDNPNTVFLTNVKPLASNMVDRAFKKYQGNETEDVAYFEPFYLKDFIATTPKKLI